MRILFCFDHERQAVLLAAGDKRGKWQDWYKRGDTAGRGAVRALADWRLRRGEDVTGMANVRNWRDVRAEALRTGRISEEGVAAARRQHDEHERSWRLRRLRQARMARQEDVAAEMKVSQSRVSRIEAGDIDHSELATLRAYVQALGGHLVVIADFGDEKLTLA